MEMTTDDRIKSVISSLFPKATDVTYEVADGSTLGYTYFIEADDGGEQASYVLKLAKTDAEHKLRFYRTDHTGQAAIDAMAVEVALLDRIAHQTTVPVPRVCQVDSSPEDPLHPYLLLERSEGTPLNLVSARSGDTWQRYLSEIGHHLATLRNVFQFQRFGSLSVCDGTVGVDDDHSTWTSWMIPSTTRIFNSLKQPLSQTWKRILLPGIESDGNDSRPSSSQTKHDSKY